MRPSTLTRAPKPETKQKHLGGPPTHSSSSPHHPDGGEEASSATNDDAWTPRSAWNPFFSPLASSPFSDGRRASLESSIKAVSPESDTYADDRRRSKEMAKGRKGAHKVTPSFDLGLFRLGHVHDQVPLRQRVHAATAPFLIWWRVVNRQGFPLTRSAETEEPRKHIGTRAGEHAPAADAAVTNTSPVPDRLGRMFIGVEITRGTADPTLIMRKVELGI